MTTCNVGEVSTIEALADLGLRQRQPLPADAIIEVGRQIVPEEVLAAAEPA
jgi:hypothetical protein